MSQTEGAAEEGVRFCVVCGGHLPRHSHKSSLTTGAFPSREISGELEGGGEERKVFMPM